MINSQSVIVIIIAVILLYYYHFNVAAALIGAHFNGFVYYWVLKL